jgi:hypothetical protein
MKKSIIYKALHLLTLVYVLSASSLSAAVIYVNPAAAGSNNGTSWADAFTSLSDALSGASYGDEIWVVQGTYKPEIAVDVNKNSVLDFREVTFQIPNGVMLFGGFTGTETERSERDWIVNVTVLSGDIDSNDALTGGVVFDVNDLSGFNAYHVIYTNNVDENTGIDGFIVNAGSASPAAPLGTTDENLDGAGWYNDLQAPSFASSPTIRNSIFQANYAASEGGAFYCTPGPAGGEVLSLIWHTDFIRNKAGITAGAVYVGSFNSGNYAPVIRGGQFIANEAVRRAGALYLLSDHAVVDSVHFRLNKSTAISPDGSTFPGSGGAVSMVASNASFSTCMFESNSATGNPTGPYEGGGGGAIHMSINDAQTNATGESEPAFFNCGFYFNIASGNTAAWGAAVVHLSDAGILRPQYVNCVFAQNQAETQGGAIANFTRVISSPAFSPVLEPAFTNCTFTSNLASQRGGGFYNNAVGSATLNQSIENSILFNNLSPDGPEVYNAGGNTTFSYSLILFSGGSGAGWDPLTGIDGGNNIDTSPGFVDGADPNGADNTFGTDDDGLRLMPASPAVSTGNSGASGLLGITIDFRGGPRILGPAVDMGAYENTGIIIPDFDLYWLAPWDKINPPCLRCPWGILLADRFFSKFDWDGPAQFIDYSDHGVVIGKIVSTVNSHITFDVYLKLEKPRSWTEWSTLNRSWLVYTPAALKAAIRQHVNWTYWELSDESYLKGTGEISGSLRLRHMPTNYKIGFQLGKGANGWDGDFGLGGTFGYAGKVTFKSKTYDLKGVGSLNADAKLCTEGCEPLDGKAAVETVTVETFLPRSTSFVYPNPARDNIQVRTPSVEGQYSIGIYDQYGQLQHSLQAKSAEGTISMQLGRQLPGIYYLRLVSESGEVQSQKIVIE